MLPLGGLFADPRQERALRVPARLVVRMNLNPAFADAASWSG
jgi:hypothetical protein